MMTYAIEERLAHVVGCTVEHDRIGALLRNQLVDCGRESGREDLVPVVTQRERQKLGNLRRVVDKQDAAQNKRYFLAVPVPGRRGFLPAQASRSMTQMRPPAV